MNYRNKNTDNPYRNQYLPAQPQGQHNKEFYVSGPHHFGYPKRQQNSDDQEDSNQTIYPSNPQWGDRENIRMGKYAKNTSNQNQPIRNSAIANIPCRCQNQDQYKYQL
jgi:hypothetical protein